jgi:hypothetical protein
MLLLEYSNIWNIQNLMCVILTLLFSERLD